jgi:hypothetical protein
MPGQQIQKGTTYVNYPAVGNSQVTAENLNDHVDNAVLLPGAISGQVESTPQIGDYVLSERSGSLFKYALSSIRDLFSASFLLRSGGSMTGELTLSSSTPSGSGIAASKGYVDTAVGGATLVGAVVMWGGSTIPAGWLEMNGQAAPVSLQSIYGSTLPDLRGEFIRGWDNGRGVDPGRGLRTTQTQDIQPHQHTLTQYSYLRNFEGGAALAWAGTATANTGLTGGTETRPRNFSLRFIVKT